MTQLKGIDKLARSGIELHGSPATRDVAVRLLKTSLPIAVELISTGVGVSPLNPISAAAIAAFQTVAALIASAGAKCNLAIPAEDIEVKVGDSGNIVYRCLHSPAHEWDLGGKKLP